MFVNVCVVCVCVCAVCDNKQRAFVVAFCVVCGGLVRVLFVTTNKERCVCVFSRQMLSAC